MARKVAALVTALVGIAVGCGGGDEERVALTREQYQSALFDAFPQGQLTQVYDAMRGGLPRDRVEPLIDDFERAVDERVAALEDAEPPEQAAEGHELLVDAADRHGDEVAEHLRGYRAEMTPDQVEELIGRVETLETYADFEDALAELHDAGFNVPAR